ncbi:UNVERIFIED_CONTAM: hypothetical protein GTU68_027675 [Idotea baltica]|nr:hypothetical protein [Idotea baltica]
MYSAPLLIGEVLSPVSCKRLVMRMVLIKIGNSLHSIGERSISQPWKRFALEKGAMSNSINCTVKIFSY